MSLIGLSPPRSNANGHNFIPASVMTCACEPTRVATTTSYPAATTARASSSLCDTKYQSSDTRNNTLCLEAAAAEVARPCAVVEVEFKQEPLSDQEAAVLPDTIKFLVPLDEAADALLN